MPVLAVIRETRYHGALMSLLDTYHAPGKGAPGHEASERLARTRMKHQAFCISLLIFAWAGLALVEASETEVRVYGLRYRDGAETVRYLEPMLSRWGGISYYQPTNSIVVNDIPSVHTRIKATLSEFDVVRSRFLMEVYDLPNRDLAGLSRNIRWKPAGGGWGVGVFEEDDYDTNVRLKIVHWIQEVQKQGARVARVVGFAGQPAELWVGSVAEAHDAKLRDYLQRAASGREMEILGALETGFSWTVTEGTHLEASLSPQILYQTPDFRGVREIPGQDARFPFTAGEWFVLSAGGRGSDVLVLLYGTQGSGEGFNLLVRISREN